MFPKERVTPKKANAPTNLFFKPVKVLSILCSSSLAPRALDSIPENALSVFCFARSDALPTVAMPLLVMSAALVDAVPTSLRFFLIFPILLSTAFIFCSLTLKPIPINNSLSFNVHHHPFWDALLHNVVYQPPCRATH